MKEEYNIDFKPELFKYAFTGAHRSWMVFITRLVKPNSLGLQEVCILL